MEGFETAEVASETLVALSRNHFSLVMYELQHHLKPLNLTDEFVIVTLAKLANGNGKDLRSLPSSWQVWVDLGPPLALCSSVYLCFWFHPFCFSFSVTTLYAWLSQLRFHLCFLFSFSLFSLFLSSPFSPHTHTIFCLSTSVSVYFLLLLFTYKNMLSELLAHMCLWWALGPSLQKGP